MLLTKILKVGDHWKHIVDTVVPIASELVERLYSEIKQHGITPGFFCGREDGKLELSL